MKQINYLAALAVTLMIGMLSSCAPKDDGPEEATLSLSSTSLTLTNAGGEAQAITVTTNQAKWNAISNADWLKTSVSGNNLQIVAMPNKDGNDRTAQVLVVAGATSEKIEVIQTAADIVLEVSPEAIVIKNTGETKLISVKSNAGAWTLDVDEAAQAWIKQIVFKDMIQLEIAANDGEAREAKLYAKSGTLQKEITVQQAGKGQKFMLPLFNNKPSKYELISYEVARGSYLVSFSAANPGLPSFGIPPVGESYNFATASAIFPTVFYLKDFATELVKVIEYVASGLNTKQLAEEGYVDFLKENGFANAKFDEAKNRISGSNPDNRFSVVVGDSKDKVAIVHFNAPGPKQPKAYKTFDKFPYDNTSYFGDPIYTSTKVKELELADGSALMQEENNKKYKDYPDFQLYKLDAKHAPQCNRAYFFDNETLKEGKPVNTTQEILAIWSDLNLGAWEVKKDSYLLTDEFVELLEKEGFVFVKDTSKGDKLYYNKAKKLMIVPRGISFAEVNEGKPAFAISYFQYIESGSATNQNTINKIMARVAEQDRMLGAK